MDALSPLGGGTSGGGGWLCCVHGGSIYTSKTYSRLVIPYINPGLAFDTRFLPFLSLFNLSLKPCFALALRNCYESCITPTPISPLKMNDPDNFSNLSLPPGCRFFPSDEQLVSYYLTLKNTTTTNDDHINGGPFDLIKEINLSHYNPFNLPEATCFRFGRGGNRRHWYFFVPAARVFEESWGRRRAGAGYCERRKGLVKDVLGGGGGGASKIFIGKRNTFVYYLEDSPRNALRTDWLMYEYALIDRNMVSFVLCRVFTKSNLREISGQALTSCGKVNIANVRDIGVQYEADNGFSISDNGQSQKASFLDHHSGGIRSPTGLLTELNDGLFGEPIDEQTSSLAILEEDYIELDDLLCSLSGVD